MGHIDPQKKHRCIVFGHSKDESIRKKNIDLSMVDAGRVVNTDIEQINVGHGINEIRHDLRRSTHELNLRKSWQAAVYVTIPDMANTVRYLRPIDGIHNLQHSARELPMRKSW